MRAMIAVLDVLVGLCFVFGLFSLLVSAATEVLMTLWAQRARTLVQAIRGLLPGDDLMRMLVQHPLVQGLGAAEHDSTSGGFISKLWQKLSTVALSDGKRADFPSYLPSGVFADSLLNLLRSGGLRKGEVGRDDAMAALIEDVQRPELRTTLQALHDSALDTGIPFRLRLQQWFDDTMERASGWYKRLAHMVLFLVGFIMAVWLNVDALHIAGVLSVNGDLRKTIATKAADFASTQIAKGASMTTAPLASSPDGSPASAADLNARLEVQMQAYNTAVSNLDALGLPLRWGKNEKLYVLANPLGAVFGWLLSGLAAAMGANFWFSMLGGLLKMRLAGTKPAAAPSTSSITTSTMSSGPAYVVQPAIPPAGMGLNADAVDDDPAVA
jgi:hypothetical protein